MWWVDGQAGAGKVGPWQVLVVVDPVDALFGGVGNIGEVVAGEVGEFALAWRDWWCVEMSQRTLTVTG
ncbi:hypothetical protein [Streptomyces nigrescens]